jgi:hypothetical protein
VTHDDELSHERRVARFLQEVQATDPNRLAAVMARHVVLGQRQLRYRRAREIPLEPVRRDE